MTSLESLAHKYLSRSPHLKRLVRDLYQFIFQVRGPARFAGLPILDLVINNAFFGFHDFCPWSHSQRYICFHKHFDSNRYKIKDDKSVVTIHFYDYKTREISTVGESLAYNWQMGARLQWVGDENKLLWNSIIENHLRSQIFNIETAQLSTLPRAVYAISNSGVLGASCNFSIIEKFMSGYGYIGDFREEIDEGVIEIFDIDKKIVRSSITRIDLGLSTSDVGFFTHIQFSTCDSLVGFFYRRSSLLNEYSTTLVIYDLDDQEVRFQVDNATVITHFCWLDSCKVLFFGEINGLRCYYTLDCFSGAVLPFTPFADLPDGHPQYCRGKIITDTYPDKRRMKTLYFLDVASGEPVKIGEFYSPKNFKDYSRVDLHPRFSRDSKSFAVDHVNAGSPSIGIGKIHETE